VQRPQHTGNSIQFVSVWRAKIETMSRDRERDSLMRAATLQLCMCQPYQLLALPSRPSAKPYMWLMSSHSLAPITAEANQQYTNLIVSPYVTAPCALPCTARACSGGNNTPIAQLRDLDPNPSYKYNCILALTRGATYNTQSQQRHGMELITHSSVTTHATNFAALAT